MNQPNPASENFSTKARHIGNLLYSELVEQAGKGGLTLRDLSTFIAAIYALNVLQHNDGNSGLFMPTGEEREEDDE